VNDHESAVECIEENRILRAIAPGSFEENDGLFVAIDDEDMAYLPGFLEGCEASGIPAEQLTPQQALRLEPMLNPQLKAAVRVPDATMDAMRMPLRFFATAKANGASLLNHMEVTGLLTHDGVVSGAAVHDHVTGRDAEIHADLTVNATGPWSEQVATMAGVDVPIRPSPGVLLALRGRMCNMVINHLHASGDGDIVVPQRALSIVGTSSWVVEDPDDLGVPDDHVARMVTEGSKLIPAVATATHRAAWSAARPLIGSRGDADSGRELSRTFKTIDHAAEGGAEGFVTITGGKGTTLRGMAEVCADVVCRKLGVDEPCRTRETVLLPHVAYFAA
jgi:glycerol-3-phosphate dehydrogenase